MLKGLTGCRPVGMAAPYNQGTKHALLTIIPSGPHLFIVLGLLFSSCEIEDFAEPKCLQAVCVILRQVRVLCTAGTWADARVLCPLRRELTI